MRPDATYLDIVGQTIWNPLGCENPTWVLNVVSVSKPDADGAITISAVEGEIRCHKDMDWYGLWRSPEMADLEETLLIEERHRISS